MTGDRPIVTQQQALAFVVALVGYHYREGKPEENSLAAVTHLEAVLGRAGFPFQINVEDLEASLSAGFIHGQLNADQIVSSMRAFHNLASYLSQVSFRLDEAAVEIEGWWAEYQKKFPDPRREVKDEEGPREGRVAGGEGDDRGPATGPGCDGGGGDQPG
ncbi:hypothetical protein KJ909_03995 [Patescibacteria group bacterium]|nr:hypothetical protein [Patescibacteria group bacterium]